MPRTLDVPRYVRLLREFHRAENRVPGYQEMLALFGYRSKSSLFNLIEHLIDAGYLRRSNHKLAFTSKITGTIRLLGAVQAGFPSPAEEELVDTLRLDEFLVRNPSATFLLTVSGDSMIDAGILPGDMVLVERGATPKHRDIVIAQVDEEWTMKYLVRDKAGVRLEAANSRYPPIAPQRSLVIAGIVRTVIRKYG